MISTTFKIPINKIKLKNNSEKNNFDSSTQFTLKGDGITNIELLCDKSKYSVNKIYLDLFNINKNILDNNNIIYEQIIETHKLEFEINDSGYKVLGLDNFFIIPTVINNKALLQIEFEVKNNSQILTDNVIYDTEQNIISDSFDDFWIKYNVVILNNEPRKILSQSKYDYEEYPIVDILEYFPTNILKHFNPPLNPQLLNLQPFNLQQLNQLPLNPQPLNLQPFNPQQLNPLPLNPQPVNLQPLNLQKNNLMNILTHIIKKYIINKYIKSKYFILSSLIAITGIIGMIVYK